MANELNIPIVVDVTATFDTKKFVTALAAVGVTIFVASFAAGRVLDKMLKEGKS